MRHKLSGRKLNRTSSHRRALFANLAKALIENESIQTTLPKAKELRPYIEKMLTKARLNTLHVRRQLVSALGSELLVKKFIEEIAPRFKARSGGYTRIVKAGFRYGDNAPMAVIQFVDYTVPALPMNEELEDSKEEATA